MAPGDKPRQVLSYRLPRPQALYPPLLREVGCSSSLIGVLLFGVVLPCAGLQYWINGSNDPGGPLFWPLAALIGGVAGAVGTPIVALCAYWLIW